MVIAIMALVVAWIAITGVREYGRLKQLESIEARLTKLEAAQAPEPAEPPVKPSRDSEAFEVDGVVFYPVAKYKASPSRLTKP